MIKVYNISIKTPIGTQHGKLNLKINGNLLSGSIISNDIKSNFYGGRISNNNFDFSGKITKGLISISYHAKGFLNEDIISGTVSTKYGNFIIDGTIAK